MKKYAFGLLLAAFVSPTVFAQAQTVAVGVAESVEGLVMVSQGNISGNLVKDSTLVNGARVVTTSTGVATIKLDNGCRIDMCANQAVTINSRLDCKALVAGVQSTGAIAGCNGAIVPALAAGGLAIGLIRQQNSSGS